MKFILSWLKGHLEIDATPEAIVEHLTRLGSRKFGMPTVFGS
ncbi:hypothetical protein [Hoeflea sp.]